MHAPRENELQAKLLAEAPKHLPDLRLFRRMVGVGNVGGREVRFGIRGQADLYGYWKGGIGVEIELKSASGRLSDDQRRWASWCEGWGVRCLVLQARADESAAETVSRWLAELGSTRPC